MAEQREAFEVIATGEAFIADNEVVVNIIDFPDAEGAIQIYARDLLDTDKLFDTFGGQHSIIRGEVRKKKSGLIRTNRSDGWVDYFQADDVITILPAEQRGRQICFDSSASSQAFIETGFRNTMDQDREFNPGNYNQEA